MFGMAQINAKLDKMSKRDHPDAVRDKAIRQFPLLEQSKTSIVASLTSALKGSLQLMLWLHKQSQKAHQEKWTTVATKAFDFLQHRAKKNPASEVPHCLSHKLHAWEAEVGLKLRQKFADLKKKYLQNIALPEVRKLVVTELVDPITKHANEARYRRLKGRLNASVTSLLRDLFGRALKNGDPEPPLVFCL